MPPRSAVNSLAEIRLRRLRRLKELTARKAEKDAEAAKGIALRFPLPGDLAKLLDPTVIVTPALELLDQTLLEVAKGSCERLIWSMSPQEGKLVADSTPVPTPSGWTTHGELKVGDFVFHPAGVPVRVTAVHEASFASLVVHTTDYGSVTVHPRHEWPVYDRAAGAWRVRETQYLAAQKLRVGPVGRGGRFRFQLPLREALILPDADLPMDPYTLGVWLGDGSSAKPAITHHPDDEYVLAYPQSHRYVHATTGIITTYYKGGMKDDLQRAGVWGNKHLPSAYLRSSEKQRRALLAGLIDTDGHVIKTGQVSFDNTNEQLVCDVAELLRTLGYRAHVQRPTPPKLSSSGIQGIQWMWRVAFTPHDEGAARLTRKAPGKLGIRRRVAISDITACDPEPGHCITVDSPDGLYLVGEQFTPTHNSQRVSRTFPLWMLLRNPELRIIIASYELGVARRWSRAIRNDIVDHPELGLKVREDTAAAHEWQLLGHKGGLYAVGVSGGLTGRPADLMVLDDPLKGRAEADSEAYRENAWDWWTETARTRLAPTAPVVLVMTRWSQDDLAGRLVDQDQNWRVINIPALCEEDDDPLGRAQGEYLTSARGRTPEQWEQIRRDVGERAWNALYQGRPAPAEGGMFKRGWWQYDDTPVAFRKTDGTMFAQGMDSVIQSWDMTFKNTDGTDFVVGQVWGRAGATAHLLDQTRARLDFPQTCKAVEDLSKRWPQATLKLIEDKANGPAVISQLRKKVPGMVPVNPEGNKQARASAVTPFVEAGNVYLPLPARAPWISAFVDEHSSFPTGTHDDQVDATSQALARLMLAPSSTAFLDELVSEQGRGKLDDEAVEFSG